MGIITISREMGSAGAIIGKKVADKLGLKYVEKQFVARIMREYGFSQFDKVYETLPNFWERFDEQRRITIDFLFKTMEAIGQVDDVVIVGRAGFGIFRDYADALHVRIQAPFSLRVKRQMEEHGMSKEEAEDHIRENDRVRKEFLESDCHFAYANAKDYDLVLNTGIVPVDLAAEWIGQAYIHLMEKGKSGLERKVSSIAVDPLLHAQVLDTFKQWEEEMRQATKRS